MTTVPHKINSIIGASAIVGDSQVHRAYKTIYREWGIEARLDQYLPAGKYGHDLELILLQFHVEGSHAWFTIPSEIKIRRYAKKQKAIAIDIPMLKPISEAVLTGDYNKARSFLVDTFTTVGELVLNKKYPTEFDFDKNKFKADYQIFMRHLLDGAPK